MQRKIILPKERFSPIDFFLEELDRLGKVTGVRLTSAAYNRMQQDPYIYQDTTEIGECEKWVGEEITIGDKYYPPLIYFLSKQADAGIIVTKIANGNQVFEFQEEPNITIDYE